MSKRLTRTEEFSALGLAVDDPGLFGFSTEENCPFCGSPSTPLFDPCALEASFKRSDGAERVDLHAKQTRIRDMRRAQRACSRVGCAGRVTHYKITDGGRWSDRSAEAWARTFMRWSPEQRAAMMVELDRRMIAE